MITSRGITEEDDVLAGEYVLGVLSLSERLSVEARMKVDPAFADAVTLWETDFSPLNAAYGELRAPNLMPKIEARLFPEPVKRRTSNFSWLQFLLGTMTAAVLVLAIILTLPDPRAGAMTATLQADAQPLVFAAAYDGISLTLTRTAGPDAETGRDYELWLIEGNAAPVSLGLIDGTVSSHPIPLMRPGMVLAVSLEPDGGSTTGAPTGPVLVTGAVNL